MSIKQCENRSINIPSRPDVSRIIITPASVIVFNQSAAPDAKIIRLVQNMNEPPEYVVEAKNETVYDKVLQYSLTPGREPDHHYANTADID